MDPQGILRESLTLRRAQIFSIEGDPRVYGQVVLDGSEAEAGVEMRLAVRAEGAERLLPMGSAVVSSCGSDALCSRGAWARGLLEGAEQIVVSFPDLEHRLLAPIQARNLGAYELSAEVLSGNEAVRISLVDPLEGSLGGDDLDPWRRRFEVASFPGGCTGELRGDWEPVLKWPAEVSLRLSGDLSGCVAIRPEGDSDGPAVAIETVGARAVKRRFTHVYRPPSQPAPLVWAPIFDLEIPGEARCRRTLAALSEAVEEEALAIAREDRRNAPVLGLSPLETAILDGVPCRQADGRAFDPVEIAQNWEAELQAIGSEGLPLRVLIIYATNLALELPSHLRSLFERLSGELVARGIAVEWIALGPEAALQGLETRDAIPWVSTLDPAFRDAVAGLLGRRWPYESILHTPETVVPLTTALDAEGLVAWRICSSSPIVEPLGVPVGTGAQAPVEGGPAYRIDLALPLLQPSAEFRAPVVEVEWEGCYAFCDRAPPGRTPDSSWFTRDSCSPL